MSLSTLTKLKNLNSDSKKLLDSLIQFNASIDNLTVITENINDICKVVEGTFKNYKEILNEIKDK